MNLIEITDLINVFIEDNGNSKVPLRLKMHIINSALSQIATRIDEQGQDLFEVITTMTPSTDGVSLPVDFVSVRDLSYNGTPIEIIAPPQRHNFDATSGSWSGGWTGLYFAYLRGNKIYFSSSLTADVDFVYTRRLPKLHRGIPQAVGATTITLATEALIGTVETSDDYYNNATIIIVSGNGIHDEQVIMDYVGSTKVATVAGWSGTTPDTDSIYEIKCELPQTPDFHTILCEIVASKFAPKNKSLGLAYNELETLLGQVQRNEQNPGMII